MLLLCTVSSACGHRQGRRSGSFELGSRRTCLVLSVGGPAGVAHIGAISALREANVRIDCVVGNSMGALVGGLFATAPAEDLDTRFQAFVAAYAQATEEDAARNGLGLGWLARRLAEENVGGKTAGALAFASAAVLGMLTTEKMEHERMVRVLDDFLHGQRIDGPLPIRFVTFYQEATNTGVIARRADAGPLAQAIGASIANPLIFTKLAVGPGRPLDPGADDDHAFAVGRHGQLGENTTRRRRSGPSRVRRVRAARAPRASPRDRRRRDGGSCHPAP